MRSSYWPLPVDAEQYLPPQQIPENVRVLGPTITWSVDKSLYYCSYGRFRPLYWIGAEKLLTRPNLMGFESGIEIQGGGQHYFRKTFSFSFFKIDGGGHAPIEPYDELFLDCAAVNEWPKLESYQRPPAAVIGVPGEILSPGDWLIHHRNGARTACPQADFPSQYTPARTSDGTPEHVPARTL